MTCATRTNFRMKHFLMVIHVVGLMGIKLRQHIHRVAIRCHITLQNPAHLEMPRQQVRIVDEELGSWQP